MMLLSRTFGDFRKTSKCTGTYNHAAGVSNLRGIALAILAGPLPKIYFPHFGQMVVRLGEEIPNSDWWSVEYEILHGEYRIGTLTLMWGLAGFIDPYLHIRVQIVGRIATDSILMYLVKKDVFDEMLMDSISGLILSLGYAFQKNED